MISSSKISFIIVWKVAGLFVSPKYIRSGSNKPRLVLNATFHSSPSFILTLLYPQANVELGEVLRAFESVDEVVNEGKGIAVLSGDQVERAIVLNEAKLSIFLLDEEDRGAYW